jgi:phosphatidylserine decarboxylase
LALEDEHTRSASVKFFGGKFNLLNKNKRLVLIFESSNHDGKNGTNNKPLRVALVVIGGVGVDTIVYNSNRNMLGQFVEKGEEVAAFRAGGSAVAMFSNQSLDYDPKFLRACENGPVELLMGESLSKPAAPSS